MKRLLKKYKDKLYTFLVLKNSAIASEYQAYVTADTERHEKHRLKSWIYLLKLNWKYRVLRGKPAKKPGNQPYLDGPESELSKRPLPIHLAMRLMKYDVISFDIFDTLILRHVSNPHAVFDLVGEKLEIQNFRKIRVQAEKDARLIKTEKFDTREVTIYDIYEQLYNIGVIENIELAVATELEVENDMCFANPYMLQIYNMLKDNGKKMYAVSDMYIPKEYMQQLLKKIGYDYFEDIMVSCDYKASKYTTELFNILKQICQNKTIIHIGDNYQSDIVASSKLGIDNYFYRGVNSYGANYRSTNLSKPIMEAYSGIVNNHLHASNKIYNIFYEYGYIYGGLVLAGFTQYINKIAKLYNLNKIILLSRDGYLIEKIYRKYFPQMNIDYLYYSRQIALRACAKEDYHSFVSRITQDSLVERSNTDTFTTIKQLFTSMDIIIPNNILEKFNLELSDIVSTDNINSLKQLLYHCKDDILDNYTKYRRAFKQYLSTILNNSTSILLVDIGWTGTTTIQLKKFISSNFSNIETIKIIYTGYTGETMTLLHNDTIINYMFSNTYNINVKRMFKYLEVILFEILFTSTEPSVSSIAEENINFSTPEIENKYIISEIQSGMLDFYKNYVEAFKNYTYLYNISGYEASAPFLYLSPNLVEYSKYFLDVAITRSAVYNNQYSLRTLNDIINYSPYLSKLFKRV